VIPKLDAAIGRVESAEDYVIIGDEITFTLVIEDADLINSLAVVPVFDTEIFDIVSAEWLLGDAMIQQIEAGTYKSVSVWEDPLDVNCAIYRITLKAKALADYTDVSFTLKLEDENGTVDVSVVPKTVAVIECPHFVMEYEQLDDMYHAKVCTRCGYAEMEAHFYDDACDAYCNGCDHEREAPHAFGAAYACDEIYHWHVCELCGIAGTYEEHSYDGVMDSDCNDCGYVRYIRGDVDNDGDVDTDDASYLVYHIFFGDVEYPVYQSLDFNGDGAETSDDGIYLLYHVFFGAASYPLN
jgi:hypothetical protein